jgi:hypothetical protein
MLYKRELCNVFPLLAIKVWFFISIWFELCVSAIDLGTDTWCTKDPKLGARQLRGLLRKASALDLRCEAFFMEPYSWILLRGAFTRNNHRAFVWNLHLGPSMGDLLEPVFVGRPSPASLLWKTFSRRPSPGGLLLPAFSERLKGPNMARGGWSLLKILQTH